MLAFTCEQDVPGDDQDREPARYGGLEIRIDVSVSGRPVNASNSAWPDLCAMVNM
jgi:hypothetical protein